MKNIQALILAAGESSRFFPLNTRHKSLIRIMGKPIIQHTIDGLRKSGINDIIIIQGPGKEIEKDIGKQPGVRYIVQKKPKGMGNAVMQAEKLVRGSFLVLNAERFDSAEHVAQLVTSEAYFAVLASKTKEPWLYGMLKIEKGKAAGIIEKPKRGREPSELKVVGIYLLPRDFFKCYRKVKEHMYAFEDCLSLMMKDCPAKIVMSDYENLPLKYPWNVLSVSVSAMLREKKKDISKSARIAKSAVIEGYVHMGDNSRVLENAVIKGPCFIGKNCLIGNNALVRESDIEDHCVVGANCEVARSVLQENVHLHSGYVGDSVIARNCRIGAGIITANVRADKSAAMSVVKGEKISTGMKSLGCMIGENCKLGIGVKTMPGVLIGDNCEIGPCSVVMKNIKSNTRFHTKFHRIVRKKRR